MAAAITSIALSSASDDTQLRDRSIVGVATCAQARAIFRSLSNGRKCKGSTDIINLLACLTLPPQGGVDPLCGVHTGRLVYQAEEASGVVEPGTRAAKKALRKMANAKSKP
jgi:hypothetical protein